MLLTFLAELDFAIAVGVLIDTIIVRGVLPTALTPDIGRFMRTGWGPGGREYIVDAACGKVPRTQVSTAPW